MIRYALVAAVLAATLATTGCQASRLTLPENYLRLESPGYPYADRAVSADGVYLAVRKSQPAQGGNLEFWTKAVRNELAGQGYLLTGERKVASADDVSGSQMDFTYTNEGREFGYTVAVWVDADRVIVAEAGGPKTAFDADRPRLDAALAAVKLR